MSKLNLKDLSDDELYRSWKGIAGLRQSLDEEIEGVKLTKSQRTKFDNEWKKQQDKLTEELHKRKLI